MIIPMTDDLRKFLLDSILLLLLKLGPRWRQLLPFQPSGHPRASVRLSVSQPSIPAHSRPSRRTAPPASSFVCVHVCVCTHECMNVRARACVYACTCVFAFLSMNERRRG